MGLLTPVAIKLGQTSWMPKLLPQVVWLDEHLQQWSRGRLSVLDIAGLPNLTLIVVGRKSGVPRSCPLLCVPHEGGWLIAGSYFGGPKMPVWVYNLRAAGEATVRISRNEYAVTAEEIPAGAERDALWQVMLATWPNYAHYESKTDRLIPVFRLTPA